MRITQNLKYSTYIHDLMRRQEGIYQAQRKLATGKDINSPSDDPVKTGNIMTARSLLSDIVQYERNTDFGIGYLNTAEKAVSNAKDVITRIQELTIGAATSTSSAASRQATGTVVSKLFDELVGIANISYNNKYVFSGYKTDTAAFDATGAYQGDTNKATLKINATSTMTLGVNGGDVFKGASGGVDIFQVVSDLVTALNTNDASGISSAISSLETSFNQLSNEEADIGGKTSRLLNTKDILTKSSYEMRMTISGLEDADITELITELQTGQIALEAALTSSGKIFNVNIFNYL